MATQGKCIYLEHELDHPGLEELEDFSGISALEVSPDKLSQQRVEELTLVGKIVGERALRFGKVMSIVDYTWPISGHVDVFMPEKNCFAFGFQMKEDRDKILALRPCNFNDQHMVIKPWPSYLRKFAFREANFGCKATEASHLSKRHSYGRELHGV